MVESAVLWDRGSDGVGRIRLNRPEKFNALNEEAFDELFRIQAEIAEDPDVRAVLLTGEGSSFCAGADLDYVNTALASPGDFRRFTNRLRELFQNFERMAQPIVAAIHGHVLAGGLELALSCDIIIAARTARIGDQHMRLGLVPSGGDTQRIPLRLGRSQAMDILLTGRWLSAQEALDIGLVSRMVEDDELIATADEIARRLAASSFPALREVKRLTHLAYSTPLSDGLVAESDAAMSWFGTPAFHDAISGFTNRKR
ncbi:hypothetical protein CH306_26315 [Rhodococcus sp. 15-725-2-2b]|uniref:enoyl-CoA hydratase/isomerase family protein n=1 Tax=unclassified Rhodococcus (in: high G+C Gram-positive bacteria) TaxID=192944 RepID=UPI000B9AB08E|nr:MULTISPECIES: enoyl-CoA hydratase/isomerase family protein [unclassified Rhodococcus (in: high G+C Gram-positive bacteria)]OZC63597.1 hypothetical protein CH277_22345 [Rhodococcus sp. 06-469-3-2]OZD40762.1 hypothetical protein CH264_24030 [Rhodococcus sp. 06-1477-1A]OZE67130.1 hypothetical protein CH306_26315 [Rhodococcus sp. 15-725-2-2b]